MEAQTHIAQYDLLFIFSHSPYGSSLGREGLEAALAAGAFDQNMAIIFMGEGLWQLKSEQDTASAQRKNHQKMTSALPMFGIDALYAQASGLDERQLDLSDFYLAAKPVSDATIGVLIRQAKQVLSF